MNRHQNGLFLFLKKNLQTFRDFHTEKLKSRKQIFVREAALTALVSHECFNIGSTEQDAHPGLTEKLSYSSIKIALVVYAEGETGNQKQSQAIALLSFFCLTTQIWVHQIAGLPIKSRLNTYVRICFNISNSRM